MWIQAAVLVQEPLKSCTGSTSAQVRWPPQRHVWLGMWLLAARFVQEPPKILQVGRMSNACDASVQPVRGCTATMQASDMQL